MNIKPGNWRNLSGEDRLVARMERIATGNTVFGGASALTLAKANSLPAGIKYRGWTGPEWTAKLARFKATAANICQQ